MIRLTQTSSFAWEDKVHAGTQVDCSRAQSVLTESFLSFNPRLNPKQFYIGFSIKKYSFFSSVLELLVQVIHVQMYIEKCITYFCEIET
jgi:hypothetical protein